MTKKKYARRLTSAIIVGGTIGLLAIPVSAAKIVSMREAQDTLRGTSQEKAAQALAFSSTDSRNGFKLLKQSNTRNEMWQKHQQMFDGIPVQGYQTIVSKVNGHLRLHGYKVEEVDQDIRTTQAAYTEEEALELAKADFQSFNFGIWKFEREEVTKIIFIDKVGGDVARLAYQVKFYADSLTKGNPSLPIAVYDALTKKRLAYHDSIMYNETAKGPGGNEKIGRYEYGTDYPALEVTSIGGGKCKMDSPNVETVDMRGEDPDGVASGGLPGGGNGGGGTYNPHEFQCGVNNDRAINGAYSPLNDGHFFGNVVFNMYKDWYNLSPISTKLRVRVHYAKNFSNAFWDGKQMTFGDGGPSESNGTKIDVFYPLVSLDVMSHEVSHGFTQFNSNLEYFGQPGGINEAFSDMAGEAAEFFARKGNDFLVGSDVVKKNGTINGQPFGRDALRFMEDPSLDGKSAKNVSEFKWSFECDLCAQILNPPQLCSVLLADKCMDVHHSSGIFNRAFFLLSKSQGWDTKKAFDVFVRANQKYWSAKTNFTDGAKGARDAAQDLGYDTSAVVKAFATVGVNI